MGLWFLVKRKRDGEFKLTKDEHIEFSCSCNYWCDNLYLYIMQKFINFLDKWMEDNAINFPNEKKEEHSQHFLFHKMNDMRIMLKHIMDSNNDLNRCMNILEKNKDALACFSFLGIYLLNSHKNNQDYFSIGNAMDIYSLLVLLKPFCLDTEENKNHMVKLEMLFKYSVIHKAAVYASY